jgi:hypothetical protein
MGVVVGVSTAAVVAEASAEGQVHVPAVAVDPVEGPMRHLPAAMELRVLRVDMRPALVTAIHGLATVLPAEISGLVTPLPRPLLWQMDAGIHSAEQMASVQLQARNLGEGPQATQKASMFLAETVQRDRAGRYAVSRGKVTKSTKILLRREI